MRALSISLVVALALPAAGCGTDLPRTRRGPMERDMAMGFARAYEAERRMTTGRAEVKTQPDPDGELVITRHAVCQAQGPNPRDERPWRWACRVYFRDRDGREGNPFYAVAVDPLGCFTAITTDFPPFAHELILDRETPNPLARIRSCPERPPRKIE